MPLLYYGSCIKQPNFLTQSPGTFSIMLIIYRSRTVESLQPLSSFLFTGVDGKELTSPTSLRHWICQKHYNYGV